MTEAFVHSVLSTDPIIKDNICTVYGIYQSPGFLIIKLERLPITLKDYIETKGPSKEILAFLKDLVNLIFYLRNAYRFQHCDLKYDNIMIKNEQVKLIDFGLGRMILDGDTYIPEGEDTQDLDIDLLMLFAHLKVFDPLSDEAYEMILDPCGF
jgi:serine/threonine protein kinase